MLRYSLRRGVKLSPITEDQLSEPTEAGYRKIQ